MIMKQFSNEQLIQKAKEIAKLHESPFEVKIGDHACCGVGFCADHSAFATFERLIT